MAIICGVDLVLNKRIEKNILSSGFLKKVFHPSELRNKNKLIGIFALKEAAMKALGRKINWLDIEIIVSEGKKPQIVLLNNSLKKIKSCDASISHDGDYTIGMVVLEI